MNQFDSRIDAIGILRFDKDENQIFGFANVFNEDASPYDSCARIGYVVLKNLMNEGVESLKVSAGSYMVGSKRTQEV